MSSQKRRAHRELWRSRRSATLEPSGLSRGTDIDPPSLERMSPSAEPAEFRNRFISGYSDPTHSADPKANKRDVGVLRTA